MKQEAPKPGVLDRLLAALERLVHEAETNYLFGEDDGEMAALEEAYAAIAEARGKAPMNSNAPKPTPYMERMMQEGYYLVCEVGRRGVLHIVDEHGRVFM